ncbi:MAG: hypothetical protein KGY67_00530 [Candidatus Thermoplasmatota archaeon]|nr:hypothetical protein [Candidatus Thermoplasmatota archaeon]
MKVFHGTLEKNIPSIREQGLIPHSIESCEQLKGESVTDLLAYKRCLNTANKVFVSGVRDYAIENCRAGQEALRYQKGMDWYEEQVRNTECAIITFDLPDNTIILASSGERGTEHYEKDIPLIQLKNRLQDEEMVIPQQIEPNQIVSVEENIRPERDKFII